MCTVRGMNMLRGSGGTTSHMGWAEGLVSKGAQMAGFAGVGADAQAVRSWAWDTAAAPAGAGAGKAVGGRHAGRLQGIDLLMRTLKSYCASL